MEAARQSVPESERRAVSDKAALTAANLEERTVADLLFRDDLTHLFNRRYMHEFLARKVRWTDENPAPLSILMMDLDHFKRINDVHGHLIGDGVLAHVAEVLRSAFRTSDLIIRYAGDEFIVLLPGVDSGTAFKLAERTLKRLNDSQYHHKNGEKKLWVSMSIGVATFPDDARDAEGLIEKADNALYNSKREGGGKVTRACEAGHQAFREEEILRNFPCPFLVGREEILAKLMRRLPHTEPGSTDIVVITGESGMGKTRLLAELVNQTQKQGVMWLVERCAEEYRQMPFHVLKALIRQLVAQHPDQLSTVFQKIDPKELQCLITHIPELAKDMPRNVPDVALTADERRELLLKGFVTFLHDMSTLVPLALLIDEFQNVDMGTLSVLLAPQMRGNARLSAFAGLTASSLKDPSLRETPLVGFCDIVSSEQFFTEISLPPLDRKAVSQMISGILPGRDADPQFDETLHHLSHGNPLYLEAILKDMVGRGLIQHINGRWQLSLPPENDRPASLDEAIRSHLGRLDPETAGILARAAVIGPTFGLDVLKAITGANTGYALALLDKAKRAAVVAPVPGREDEELTFVNPRVRKITYETLDPEQKKLTHETLAEKEAERYKNRPEDTAAMLAFHFERAGNAGKTQEFMERARKYASGIFAFSKALAFLRAKMGELKEGDKPLSLQGQIHLRTAFQHCLDAIEQVRSNTSAGKKGISNLVPSVCLELRKAFLEVDTVTISWTNGRFLVNGLEADAAMLGKQAIQFFDVLSNFNGRAITIAQTVRECEIEALLNTLASETRVSSRWQWDGWRAVNNVRGLSVSGRIESPVDSAMDKVEEEKEVSSTGQAHPVAKGTAEKGQMAVPLPIAPPSDLPGKDTAPMPSPDTLLSNEAMALIKERAEDHARTNDAQALMRTMGMIQERLSSSDTEISLQASRMLKGILDLALLHKSEALLVSAAMVIENNFGTEIDPARIATLVRLAPDAILVAIQFGNHELAKRIVGLLRSGNANKRFTGVHLQLAFEKLSNGEVLDTLIEDLCFGSADRSQAAANVIACLGEFAVPRLIDVLKTSPDFPTRKIVTELLATIKSFPAKEVLSALSAGSSDEECDNVMSIFETLSRDLKGDIRLAISHRNPRVRLNAIWLLTRVREDWVGKMLLELALSSRRDICSQAIKAIGDFGGAAVGKHLLSILPSLADEDLERECYLALGKLRYAPALSVLEQAASPSKFLGFFGGKSKDVRTAAVWAIEQINNGRAIETPP